MNVFLYFSADKGRRGRRSRSKNASDARNGNKPSAPKAKPSAQEEFYVDLVEYEAQEEGAYRKLLPEARDEVKRLVNNRVAVRRGRRASLR